MKKPFVFLIQSVNFGLYIEYGIKVEKTGKKKLLEYEYQQAILEESLMRYRYSDDVKQTEEICGRKMSQKFLQKKRRKCDKANPV